MWATIVARDGTDKNRGLVGAVGVSGDTSCADHNIAWRTRANLGLDFLATNGASGGAGGSRPDNIIYDITTAPGLQIGTSAGGFGHPACAPDNGSQADSATLPAVE